MLATIRQKIRALVEDYGVPKTEIFDYTVSDVFNICGKVSSITSVTIDDIVLGSEEYEFNSMTNELKILINLSASNIIIVKYIALKYTDAELDEYIRASLVWLSYFSFCNETDFELEGEIYPTPTNKEEDLIALISSILIKPDYTSYRLPNLTVNYPRTMSKEDRIEFLISRFKRGLGVNDVLEWDVE